MKINKLNYVRVKEFTVAELKKLESIMVEQGFSVIEAVSEYFKSNYSQYGVDMEGNTCFLNYRFTDKGKDITDKFRNFLDNDESVVEEGDNTKTFTKSDLKDGMVVTYRDRSKGLVYWNKIYESCFSNAACLNEELPLSAFNENLNHENNYDYDLIKVEYMGEVLWERKEKPKTVKLELDVTPEQAKAIKKQLGIK